MEKVRTDTRWRTARYRLTLPSAAQVQLALERLLPELRDLEQRKIFTHASRGELRLYLRNSPSIIF